MGWVHLKRPANFASYGCLVFVFQRMHLHNILQTVRSGLADESKPKRPVRSRILNNTPTPSQTHRDYPLILDSGLQM